MKKSKGSRTDQPTTVITAAQDAIYQSLTSKYKLFILLALLVFSLVLYFQVIPYGYVLDDKIVVSDNQYVKEGFNGISKIFGSDSFQGYFGEQKDLVQGGRYRPLSIASFAVEYQFFGLNPSLSHIFNIVLYALCGLVLFLFLRRLLKETDRSKWLLLGVAGFTTLLFIAQPIHTEAVANIKGRDEIMSFLFSILSAQFALKFMDERKISNLLFLFASFLLGLFAKENTITFLGIIPLGILLFRKFSPKRLFGVLGVMVLATAIYLIIRFQVIGYLINNVPSTDVMNNPFVGMTIDQKYATISYTLLKYLILSVWPYPLTHDYYPYHIPIMEWSNPMVILSLLLHIFLIMVMIRCWKSNKVVTYGIAFYFMALSIVSNIVINVGTFMNERFIFTASMGMLLVMVRIITNFKKWPIPNFRNYVLTVIILVYGLLSFQRVPVWQSELALNSAAIKVSKNSARANSFMATAIFNNYKTLKNSPREERMRMMNEAEGYVNKALELIPDYGNANLMKAGIAAEKHKMTGKLDPLLKSFAEVIGINPKIGFVTEYLKYINDREDAFKLLNFYLDIGYNELIVKQKNFKWGIHFLNLGYQMDDQNENINLALKRAYLAMGNENEAMKFGN